MSYLAEKYAALMISLAIIVLLWVGYYFSVFSILNGYSYDVLMRRYPSRIASEKLILIEIDPAFTEQGDDVWKKLLSALLLADAEAIALTFFPEGVTSEFYQLAARSKKTVFAVHVDNTTVLSFNDDTVLPDAARNLQTVYGLISKPPVQNGVFRKQHGVVTINSRLYPGFEKKVAEMVVDNPDKLPDSDYRINFIGYQYRIPRVSIDRVLNGGLVSELVSGRTVLIGFNQHPSLSQFYTPVSTATQMTDEVMFHAFALDTLLSNRQIDNIPDWALLLCLLFVTAVSLFVGQWLGFKVSLYVSAISSVIYIVICWVGLGYFFIWIPLTEILLGQWLSFILVWAYRVHQEQKGLEQLLFGFPLKARESSHPVNLYNSDEPWELLISMINQSLNLNRLIFLERVVDDHRLKEIKAMNCSMSDILERRRDYQRFPYSRAINANRPVLLEKDYLRTVSVVEHQYMAPLIFAEEVLGFWVYTVEPRKIKSQAKFNALTYSFMVQVSEVLHYRQQWKQRLKNKQIRLWDYLQIAGNQHVKQLNQSATLMDKRVYELQAMFNSINTSCVLYNLFGRVLMTNDDMDSLAQQASIRLFNMSLLEFIIEITEYDETGARNMIQKIIFDHDEVAIPVTHNQIQHSFMLHIVPLRYDDHSRFEPIPDESQVFQISGVLCELLDVTELKKLYQLKEQMFQRFCFRMRDDLRAILSLAPNNEQVAVIKATDESLISQTIQSKTRHMLDMLEQVDEQLSVDTERMLTNNLLCFPVDASIAIQTALSRLQKEIEKRQIKVSVHLPEMLSLVFASPVELEFVLFTVLQMMVNDTYEADELWIQVEENKHQLICRINNSGIGLSTHQPQEQDDHFTNPDGDLFNFNYAIQCVNRWGGRLDISSKMGEGSSMVLVLKRFL